MRFSEKLKAGFVMSLFALCAVAATALAGEVSYSSPVPTDKPFYIYSDQGADNNHFTASGYMGDYNNIRGKMGQKVDPYSGETCMRFVYTPNNVSKDAQWAGVMWQNPEGNWGSKDGGYDLSKAKRLTFWARGKNGGEVIDKFQVGGIDAGIYPDSDSESIGPVQLTADWKKYTIDLEDAVLDYVSGGFSWATSAKRNPNGVTLYLDEVRYEFE